MMIYDGKSLLDGEPIIVVAIPDYSIKVGHMLTTWILCKDVSPMVAIETGKDSTICGDCKYMMNEAGERICYVRVHREPALIWDKAEEGEYPLIKNFGDLEAEEAQVVNPFGMPVRFGAYGDPAAVPFDVWIQLAYTAARFTGYCHQWKTTFPALKTLCMASVDTPEERKEAQDMGWRTYYVGNEQIGDDILCPASEQFGRKTTCDKCNLCQGTTSTTKKSIWIPVHGPGKEFAI